MTFKAIDCAQLKERLSEDNLVIADIRDVNSFNEAHIPNSINVSNENIAQFMMERDFEQPIIVVCYHGISSQGAANYLIGQDFEDVYSLVGGFTDWASKFPGDVAKA
ncbi:MULTISPECIES: thiosulfate sulfurtransferase GlpE [unclassified Pseudoalteromonas]|uniref:thiosulfate sulfurtransferase GlpE n=1 Tax=unclassified Pseudoalteromonas TaxID=194690 RepID=UPI0005A65811|nr:MULTISPECIES: thiosulfate sulfurtransferase GlpE [unclassified Pseudoalteromonas]MBU2969954.1 thiosulfate sulfurtransferase GlpE [Pseudoalteromonas sp. C2R02]